MTPKPSNLNDWSELFDRLFDRLLERLSTRLITRLKSNFYFKIQYKMAKFFVFRVLRILAVILTPKLTDFDQSVAKKPSI